MLWIESVVYLKALQNTEICLQCIISIALLSPKFQPKIPEVFSDFCKSFSGNQNY